MNFGVRANSLSGGVLRIALVGSLGGSTAGEHGVGWTKRGLLALQWDRRAVELHEQIKRVFDPKGLLNPETKLASYPGRSPGTRT